MLQSHWDNGLPFYVIILQLADSQDNNTCTTQNRFYHWSNMELKRYSIAYKFQNCGKNDSNVKLEWLVQLHTITEPLDSVVFGILGPRPKTIKCCYQVVIKKVRVVKTRLNVLAESTTTNPVSSFVFYALVILYFIPSFPRNVSDTLALSIFLGWSGFI